MKQKPRIRSAFTLIFVALFSASLGAETPLSPLKLQTEPPLNIVYLQDKNSAITEFQIHLGAGIRSVPGNLRGLAFLAARTAMEIPSADSVKKLMEMGTRLSSWVEGDRAILSMTTLSDHFPASLEILATMLNRPLVTGIRIQRIKEWMQYRERAENDSPLAVVMQAMVDHFLGAKGYAGSGTGCESTRSAITRAHVARHLEAHYHAARMWISVVSDLEAEQVQALLREKFKLQVSQNPPPSSAPATAVACPCSGDFNRNGGRKLLQPLAAWGMPLPPLDADSFATARVLSRLLAKGPGSLAWHLRDPLGLAYTVGCDVSHFQGGGVLLVFMRTGPKQVARACKEMEALLNELVEKGVSQEQLSAAVRLERVAWQRGLQSKSDKARLLGAFAQNGPGIDEFMRYDQRLQRLTTEAINLFLRQCLPAQNRRRILMGDFRDSEEEKQ